MLPYATKFQVSPLGFRSAESNRQTTSLVYAPNRGRVSDVFGMFSEMDSMKMENERRIEIPREIFSPWSGGERKVTRVSEDSMTQGKMRFNVKKRCRRTSWNDAATCRIKTHQRHHTIRYVTRFAPEH